MGRGVLRDVGRGSVGKPLVYKPFYVLSLAKHNRGALASYLNVEEVGDRALVVHVPPSLQILREAVVERVLVVGIEEDEEVVHVAPDDDSVETLAVRGIDLHGAFEDAGVGVALLETPLFQPREEGALPPPAGLRKAVHWLDYLPNAGAAVGPELAVRAGRCLAVHGFALFELALQVRGHEIPAVHSEAVMPR